MKNVSFTIADDVALATLELLDKQYRKEISHRTKIGIAKQRHKVKTLFETGFTISEIAEACGIGEKRVCHYLASKL